MTLATKPRVYTVETLGNYAHQALQKHFKKTLKWETDVKKDKDPEALHQMRVGLRRLRTAVSRFAPAIDLPKSVSEKNIGKIARCLGNLRDLDVLQETLQNRYQPNLPGKEQKLLQKALDVLDKQREDALLRVREIFKEERYKSLKQEFKEWLEEPSYQPLASVPIQEVLPDLLLPEVSSFLLHPGWLVGTLIEDSEIVIPTDWEAHKIEHELTETGETLHDLRKQAKRLRYQMELFTDSYAESFKAYVTEVKNIQEILGSIQDSAVLTQWLADALDSNIHSQLPTLATLLASNRYESWQQWQPLQQRYMNHETRHRFHLTLLHPI
ncbi:CHAD domain-containing protein [Iningainema tapete]|uniref:CHAD domain-containing protein n=1 Tax=Iningainema tapete BLCC-T55 TaxID=2748662 RepID=A0A8J7BX96_9CYAN|nr:CHAD domain-containing protein [Iningainema tapete]MBD2773387.1 CHAD domain-containing protein [Iningainema tapete BLCC-T55]